MDQNFIKLLRCPRTNQALIRVSDNELTSQDGAHSYRVIDGIYHLLPNDEECSDNLPDNVAKTISQQRELVKSFYDDFGWETNEQGHYKDSASFVDDRGTSYEYTRRCMRNVSNYLPHNGAYILDAASGAIPHEEYMKYHEHFNKRICVDFSIRALQEARLKLGDRGEYVLGDLTNMPFKDGTVDALICNHAVYHVPSDLQATAFEELARVVAPGGRSVIVYTWPDSLFERGFGKILRMFGIRSGIEQKKADRPPLYVHPHDRNWFKSKPWKFRYSIRCWRLVGNAWMQRYLPDNGLGRLIVKFMLLFQAMFPSFAGKIGRFPMIIISK